MADQSRILRKYTVLIILAWTLLHLFVLFIGYREKKAEMLYLAREEAKAIFEKDVIYRRWNALNGGVYVPVSDHTPSNPYLADVPERDITTPSGRKLTLVNPAYMTRQAHEIASKSSGILGHITSLKPIRPGNAPDEWEGSALNAFEKGAKDFSSIEFINGTEYLRYMSPLKTEEACLKCHASQGYKVGDIRGGISVSVTMDIFRGMFNRSMLNKLMSYGILWFTGLLIIGVGSKWLRRDISRLRQADLMTQKFATDLEKLLSVSSDMTMTKDLRTLYRKIVTTCRDILDFDCSTLMLLSPDMQRLTVEDCIGFPESMIGTFSLMDGQGLSTLVAHNRRPDIVTDFATESRFEIPAIVREMRLASAIAVPMMMNEEVFGVLIGHSRQRKEFSSSDIALYQHVANQAAVAVRNLNNIREISKKESKMRHVIESIGEGLYVLDGSGNLVLMNTEAERLLGWTAAELRDKNMHNVIHNRRADGATLLYEDCPMHRVAVTGEQYISEEEVFVHRSGNVFPVFVISTPLVENGTVESSITIFRDISEKQKLERDREALIEELQNALAEIKTLHGILPICSFCKKIRDDKGAWKQLEAYISDHTDAQLSHGLCEDCASKMYPQYFRKEDLSEYRKHADRNGGEAGI